jgi:cytochrome c
MKTLTTLALTAALAFSGAAFANADLAKKNACIACHDASAKKMGPSWKDVAAKHKGQKDAEKMLAESIVKGSKDKYGKIPMPPQTKAAADAPALAAWILTH